jgi:hypothetical protein
MYNSTVALDQLAQSQAGHATTANQILAALSASALFGIKQSASYGLTLVLYGGNMPISGTPTAIADQTVTLTASTTNYLYATAAGVLTKVTSAPAGWPGPLAAGAIALYDITTDASRITGGNCRRLGLGTVGDTGTTGAQGNPGVDVPAMRLRLLQPIGNGSTAATSLGFYAFSDVGTATARTVGTSSLRESIPYIAYQSSASAGSSAGLSHTSGQTWCYLGNAAGRGGFTLAIRFCFESSLAPANQRCFIGIYPGGTIGNVEPDTLLNIIGVGAKAGDANLSIMHNDGSGSATMSSLGANFPARATDNVYELLLASVANSGIVTYTLTNIATGDVAAGSLSTDLPVNTTFLTAALWVNNGSTASATAIGLMQVVGETRY